MGGKMDHGACSAFFIIIICGADTYLDHFVPSGRDNDWVEGVWREAHGGDPFGVAFFCEGEFALAKGVPHLD